MDKVFKVKIISINLIATDRTPCLAPIIDLSLAILKQLIYHGLSERML